MQKKVIPIPKLTQADIDRFWSKVKVGESDECWEWIAGTRVGYGEFFLNGTGFYSHRIAFLISNIGFDQSLHVLHKCDNRPCCNPNHLFQGTPRDNARDRSIKGIGAKLKKSDVEKIVEMRKEGLIFSDIAKVFSITTSHACRVYWGKARLCV